MHEELYTKGNYLEKNPTWHAEESPWKAQQILRMLARHAIHPKTICEVGCGAGEVLRQLQERLDDENLFWGYDISPQAYEFSRTRANERLQFKLADIRQEQQVFFDLILILDVIEHLEDYFSFLREVKPKSTYKILHIPLDLSVQTMVRSQALLKVRESYGHLHYFSKELALQVVKDANYEIIDYFYTPRAIEVPSNELSRKLLKLPRRMLFTLHQDGAARLLGGWSLLLLAR
jgi:cyclopropane fatty-acyl-phospholipid synthase-like methyltransferase